MSGRKRAPAADLRDVALERRVLATAITERRAGACAALADLPADAFAGKHCAALRVAIVAADGATPEGERLDGLELAQRFAAAAGIDEAEARILIGEMVGPKGDSTLWPKLAEPAFKRACDKLAKLARLRAAGREVWRAGQAIEDGTGSATALASLKGALADLDTEPAAHGAIFINVADVPAEPVRWFWMNRIPIGKLSLLVGDPGCGKSCLTLALAAAVTRGGAIAGDAIGCEPGSVLLLSAEDDVADTIRPRLDAAGADVSRVAALQAMRAGAGERAFDLTRDIPTLERVAAERGDVRLIIIDPISAYLGATDSHCNADVRGLLAPLGALAQRIGAAVVAVTHLNKGAGGKALYRATGSLAFTAAARAAWLCAADPEDATRRVLVALKSNLGPEAPGLAYRLVDDGNGRPIVEWLGPCEVTAADVTRAEVASRRQPRPGALDDCKEWLRDKLAGRSEGWPAAELEELAEAEGHFKMTLRRAAKALGVRRRKDGMAGGWRVSLPGEPAEDAQAAPCDSALEHLRVKQEGFPKMLNPESGRDDLSIFGPGPTGDVTDGVAVGERQPA